MFLLLLLFASVLLYAYFTRNHNYWSKRNVKHDKTIPVFGTHLRNSLGLKSLTDISVDIYNRYPGEKLVGYYRGNTPVLIIRDPDIVKEIVTKDFLHYTSRGLGRNPEVEPLNYNLFSVEGDIWKVLRTRLTTVFTTAKLKAMFPLIIDCAQKLQGVALELTKQEEYDVRELMARFTTEFIGSCGFGIEMNSINDNKSQFRALGKLIFEPKLKNFVLFSLQDLVPEITRHVYAGKKEVENAITEIFLNIRSQRNGKPIGRHDFMDLLLELEAKGKLEGESLSLQDEDGSPAKVEYELNVKILMAQIFVFFAAGFETSSSATSYCLHRLAFNPDVQRRVQEDIDRVLAKYDNKLCYDAIAEMSLLDMAFKEAMRLFPSLGFLSRVCTKRHTIPYTDVTIDPGVRIVIPIQAIQNDEKYFDNPSEFRPERFKPEEVQKRHKTVYLPFGTGPRNCIGERLGHMQSLAGLAALLHKFSFEPSKNTRQHLQANPKSNIVQAVSGGIPLKITERVK